MFRLLFEREGRILRSWSPDKGASLETFVRLVARRHALSVLRTKRRSPWSEQPEVDVDQMLPDHDSPEVVTATREILRQVVRELRAELSPRGLAVFELLIVDEASVEQVQERLGMSRDAVYAWRSRLTKAVRAKTARLMAESPLPARRRGVEAP